MWLTGRAWQVTAANFSPTAVQKGRHLTDARGVQLEWIIADLLEYTPPAATFNAALVAYLHLPATDRAGVLAYAAGAPAPGGVLVAIGHDLSYLTDGVGGPQDSTILYTPDTIVAELPGLRIRARTVPPPSVHPGQKQRRSYRHGGDRSQRPTAAGRPPLGMDGQLFCPESTVRR